jgi:hypothetical protein
MTDPNIITSYFQEKDRRARARRARAGNWVKNIVLVLIVLVLAVLAVRTFLHFTGIGAQTTTYVNGASNPDGSLKVVTTKQPVSIVP